MEKYKLGSAVEISPAIVDGVVTVNPTESVTVVNLDMVAATTINIGAGQRVRPGALMIVIGGSDGTARNLTFGTGFTCPVLTGTISKKKSQTLVYAGGSWKASGAPQQID